MKPKKLSLEDLQGKMSKSEMKQIMAGSATCNCNSTDNCSGGKRCFNDRGGKTGDKYQGVCETP